MRNKIVGLIATAVLALLVWYLFLKPYDYLVSITAKTIPGVVNQNIKLWANTHKNTVYIRQKDFFNIDQQLRFKDSIFQYQWKITPVNDSATRI